MAVHFIGATIAGARPIFFQCPLCTMMTLSEGEMAKHFSFYHSMGQVWKPFEVPHVNVNSATKFHFVTDDPFLCPTTTTSESSPKA